MAQVISFIFSDNIDVEKQMKNFKDTKMRYAADFIVSGKIDKSTEVVAKAIETSLDEGQYRKNRIGNLDVFNNRF